MIPDDPIVHALFGFIVLVIVGALAIAFWQYVTR
jgi:hypothetical protein